MPSDSASQAWGETHMRSPGSTALKEATANGRRLSSEDYSGQKGREGARPVNKLIEVKPNSLFVVKILQVEFCGRFRSAENQDV